MSPVQHMREFISARLTAAAEEIFSEFEKTIVEYEEEIDSQRRLLEITWKPQRNFQTTELSQQHVHEEEEEERLPADQQLRFQETSSGLDQEEFPGMKEEQENVCTRQGGEQFVPKQENDDFISAFILQEDDFTAAEPNTNRLQEGNEHLSLEPSRDTENKPKQRHERNTSCIDDGENSPVSESRSDSETSEKVLGLVAHTTTQKDGKLHPCEKCGKHFAKKYLSTHMRIHTGERPFACHICGKSFSTSSYLTVHKRIHTGEKLFSCERCGKRFTCKSNLSTHMRTHTGARPFPCKVCGKGFTQSGSLSIHMRTHTGERAYSCEICGKHFLQIDYLRLHMRVHTVEAYCERV